MTTEEYFKKIASDQELKPKEQEVISKKHNFLRDKLRVMLPAADDFLTGSYSRNTMIRPQGTGKFDVDLFLVFSKQEYGEKQLPELLKIVEDTLHEIKREDTDILKIEPQKRSIGVIYKENFQIDVVPAIEIEKDKLYKIFDKRTQKPVQSNPKLHSETVTTANDVTASGSTKRLVPIVKIIKFWKRKKCDYAKSFHMEMLVVKILNGGEIKSFSEGVAKFFIEAEKYLQNPSIIDPANKNNIIDTYLDEDGTRAKLLELVVVEKGIAKEAIEAEGSGNSDQATDHWKRIFEDEDTTTNDSYAPDGPVVSNLRAKPWAN